MRWHHPLLALVAGAAALVASGNVDAGSSASTTPATTMPATTMSAHEMDPADRAAAMLATAGYQDVATAEAAGYASSLDTLGCFTDPVHGGMGVHYINQSLMDDTGGHHQARGPRVRARRPG